MALLRPAKTGVARVEGGLHQERTCYLAGEGVSQVEERGCSRDWPARLASKVLSIRIFITS